MRIYIPSYRRATKQHIEWSPLKWFSPAMKKRTTYVVGPGEADAYRPLLPPEVELLECDRDGALGLKREWICRLAQARGEAKHAQIDDDVIFYTRIAEGGTSLRYSTPADTDEMFDWIERQLDTNAMVGISPREGNNRSGPGNVDSLTEPNTRIMRVLCFQTEPYAATEHGRVETMQDFDSNLQLLRAGHSNCISFWWAQGHKGSNTPGGCATYRTVEMQARTAHKMVELHPGFVRTKEVSNKGAGEYGKRTDVMISWKKAAAEGAKKNG